MQYIGSTECSADARERLDGGGRDKAKIGLRPEHVTSHCVPIDEVSRNGVSVTHLSRV